MCIESLFYKTSSNKLLGLCQTHSMLELSNKSCTSCLTYQNSSNNRRKRDDTTQTKTFSKIIVHFNSECCRENSNVIFIFAWVPQKTKNQGPNRQPKVAQRPSTFPRFNSRILIVNSVVVDMPIND